MKVPGTGMLFCDGFYANFKKKVYDRICLLFIIVKGAVHDKTGN